MLERRPIVLEVGAVGKKPKIGLFFAGSMVLLVLAGGVVHAAVEPSVKPGSSETLTPPSPPHVTWHFEGRHSGIENFQANTNLCPVLDHRLHETFTLTDGSTWDFQAHYCGTIDTHGVWTGVGSFVITTSWESTLSGTFTDSAQLPSVGVPYELDVSSGSGIFAGAKGSCTLDNHLSPIAPGEQSQEGIFVCDLSN